VLGIPDGSRGCLFDLDGAATQTARVRPAAWPEIFDDFRRQRARRTGERLVPSGPVAGLVVRGLPEPLDVR
jgi:beta-phosphoglucomutase-like phosphatase (HAD superfamily)